MPARVVMLMVLAGAMTPGCVPACPSSSGGKGGAASVASVSRTAAPDAPVVAAARRLLAGLGRPTRAGPPPDRPLARAVGSSDELDLRRLAEVDGARRLLDAVEAGGPPARSALAALAYADDAEAALDVVCTSLRLASPPSRAALLPVIHAVVTRPPSARERLAVEGYAVCERALAGLDRATLPAAQKDLVSSARAGIREQAPR